MSGNDVQDLITALENMDPTNPDAQWRAAEQLGKVGNSSAIPPLIEALKSHNQALVRANSAKAFWNERLVDERALEPLISSLNDSYYLVRSYAARALANFKELDTERNSVLALMKVLTDDPHYGPTAEAAQSIGAICTGDESRECKDALDALERYDRKSSHDERWKSRAKREVLRARYSETLGHALLLFIAVELVDAGIWPFSAALTSEYQSSVTGALSSGVFMIATFSVGFVLLFATGTLVYRFSGRRDYKVVADLLIAVSIGSVLFWTERVTGIDLIGISVQNLVNFFSNFLPAV